MSLVLIERLQQLRDEIGEPIRVSSGCRCPIRNKEVGGSSNSYHLTTLHSPCLAADIVVELEKEAFKKLAVDVGFSGVGLYDRHYHIDVRPKPLTVWEGVSR